jgi:hypothetical protein
MVGHGGRRVGVYKGRPSVCHPDRPNKSRGLCEPCDRAARWKNRHPAKKVLTAAKRRESYLLRTYGITEADYQNMLEAQGGRCAICRKKPVKMRLRADHDHEIEKKYGVIVIRGLVCSRCNRMFLAAVEYSDLAVLNGIKYLQKLLDTRAEYALQYTASEQQEGESHG